jgi:PAS domain S-box-containing protein
MLINLLTQLLATLPGHVYWKDLDGRYLGCNQKFVEILGFTSPQDIIDKTDFDFLSYDKAKLIQENDWQVITAKQELAFEEEGVDQQGNPAFYLTHKAPLYDEKDHIIGILGVTVNITIRKEAEKQLKIAKEKAELANKAKSDFLAVVSHELRTPLTAIIGLAEMLKVPNFSAEKKLEFTDHLINSSQHLLGIVNDILDFAQLEENKFQLIPSAFNLQELIKKVIGMLYTQAMQKGLSLSLLHYPTTLPKHLKADIKALSQILINLIGNAIKFTNAGSIDLIVQLHSATTKHAAIEIIVADTGIGIPANKLEKIFERFEQVNQPQTRTVGGTGLGLAVTKKLVEMMDGTITVESTLGRGTRFTVNLLLEIA